MRTFIAVEIPEEIQKRVGAYISEISRIMGEVKWVTPRNLHFTIKFLGEISDSDFRNVQKCVEEVANEFSSFTVGISGIGFFPSQHHPKVIWLGTDGGESSLLELYQEMERRMEEIGFDREAKTFSPHLTIGRVKKFKHIEVPALFADFEPVTFEAQSMAIIKSTLTPDGPIYEKMFGSELKSMETLEREY